MPVVVGLNHRTASIQLREQLAFTVDETESALQKIQADTGIDQLCLLSTCNRTELYAVGAEANSLQQWLIENRGLSASQLNEHLYSYQHDRAAEHLFKVACGLDSMVLGEPQILGQLKQAYSAAQHAQCSGPELGRLFDSAFRVAKQVRSNTDIGAHPVSAAFAAVTLAKQIFADFDQLTALLIGAGETAELACRHLRDQGVRHFVIANRTVSRAQALAQELQSVAIGLPDLPNHLADADIVISSTGSRDPVLHYDAVKHALKKRRHKPVFMVDLAVPRDIEERVAKLEDIYLYSVDDLQQVVQVGLDARQRAAAQAADIIHAELSRYRQAQRARSASGLIRQLRGQAELQREQLLAQAKLNLTNKGAEAALEILANQLTNKLLHQPTQQLTLAAEKDDQELLDAARRLYDLKRKT